MSTTIVTRATKGGRLSFTDMDNNLLNLKATADAAAAQSTTYTKTEVNAAIASATPSFSTLTGKPTTVSGYGITDAMTATAITAAIASETTRAVAAETLLQLSIDTLGAANVSAISSVGDEVIRATDAESTLQFNIDSETARAVAAEGLLAPQLTTYTKTETDARIQAVVGVAPAALDTLAEIAAQLALDESFTATLVTTISGKVDK